MTKKEKELRNLQIVQMRRNGMSMSEIAEVFGLSFSGVHYICECFGVAGTMSNRKAVNIHPKNGYTNGKFDRIANAIRYITERTPNFEYAGNYTGIDGFVDLKCKTCGAIIHKSFVTVKHGTAVCNICLSRKREEEKETRRVKKLKRIQAEEEARKWEEAVSLQCSQMEMTNCKYCGRLFIPTGNRAVYCSDICSKKMDNSAGKDKRLRKIKRALVDKDISLIKLYKRDNGRCYLCGNVCDWEDYTIDNGNFIAGNHYPSIDHVVPLSRGGKHAWDNVKLACRLCNSLKSDDVIPRHPVFDVS